MTSASSAFRLAHSDDGPQSKKVDVPFTLALVKVTMTKDRDIKNVLEADSIAVFFSNLGDSRSVGRVSDLSGCRQCKNKSAGAKQA
jgi:hypothetical protein